MKYCTKCGRWYEDEKILNCKKDGTPLTDAPDQTLQLSPDELKKRTLKDWLWLIIGMPVFMLLMYGLYYVMAVYIKLRG